MSSLKKAVVHLLWIFIQCLYLYNIYTMFIFIQYLYHVYKFLLECVCVCVCVCVCEKYTHSN